MKSIADAHNLPDEDDVCPVLVRTQLQSIKEQLRAERATLPLLRHVLFEWPDDGVEPSRCPVPLPPAHDLASLSKKRRIGMCERNLRRFRGWVGQHALVAQDACESWRERALGVARFRALGNRAGAHLRGLARVPEARDRQKPGALWLSSLHELVKPDRRFTWCLGGIPAYSVNIPTPRTDGHYCSVFDDAVLASILAIDNILDEIKGKESGVVKLSRSTARVWGFVRDKRAMPTYDDITHALHMGRSTVSSALKELREKGLIPGLKQY